MSNSFMTGKLDNQYLYSRYLVDCISICKPLCRRYFYQTPTVIFYMYVCLVGTRDSECFSRGPLNAGSPLRWLYVVLDHEHMLVDDTEVDLSNTSRYIMIVNSDCPSQGTPHYIVMAIRLHLDTHLFDLNET